MLTFVTSLALLALPSTAESALRERVNVDFAWRHYLGESPTQPGQTLPAAAAKDYDDSGWEMIDAPHDMLFGQARSIKNPLRQGFIPRGAGWYRKHFHLPTDWNEGGVWIAIEGAFHVTTAWLNGAPLGKSHVAGYTSFYLPLHTAEGANWGGANVLALFVNATTGTGWWYEGGGLMRHQWLVRTAHKVFIEPDGAWAHADVDSGAVMVEASVVSELAKEAANITLDAAVYAAGGTLVGHAESTQAASLPAGAHVTLPATVPITGGLELWSVARPHLYTVVVTVRSGGNQRGGSSPSALDTLNITIGARTAEFAPEQGFFLNKQPVKLRGFCDHSNFGAVGGAVPDRMNLFRLQGLRGVGGNAWRMAHNPPIPIRLDMMDALGVLAMDENRDYGGGDGQGGTTSEGVEQELADTVAMVRRDRSHPSIVLWSLCNEVGCNNESSAAAFRAAILAHDTTRPITQNHLGKGVHPLSMASLDVQGFSHKRPADFDRFHADNPTVPMLASECCSCLSQRGEDTDWCPNPRPTDGCSDDSCTVWCGAANGSASSRGQFYQNEIADCTAQQVNYSDGRADVAGTFVWSGFDYLGEARGWPQVSKPRGTIGDTAGFAKESFYWLKQWWLSRIPLADAGRPPLPDERTIFIVDSWADRKARADKKRMPAVRTVHVYTDAPFVALELNGERVNGSSSVVPVPAFGNVALLVPYSPGNLTAVALDAEKSTVLATFTRRTPGAPASIRLSLDAPSVATGTGEAVVADGEDVALVRAELLDRNGVVCDDDVTTRVSFSVDSGEGRLWATANGDPADTSLSSPYSASRLSYHGLVRAVVRSSSDHASSPHARRRMRTIDIEGGWRVAPGASEMQSPGASEMQSPGASHMSGVRVAPPADEPTAAPLAPIVLRASASGMPDATLTIPLTADAAQLPLAVARRSGSSAWR
jgi:beta-galactosidase/beta-glucuronidase